MLNHAVIILLGSAVCYTHVIAVSLNLTLVAVDSGTHSQGQLYNLDSKYGNQEQLIELNKAIREAGMTPVADIVINHRCADEQVRARAW